MFIRVSAAALLSLVCNAPPSAELSDAVKARPELDEVLHLGLARRSVEAVFKEMDLDGDGEITVSSQ